MNRFVLVAAAVFVIPQAARAAISIGFDNLANQTIVSNQYQPLGVIFSGNFVVFGPSTTTNAISAPNSVGYYDPTNQANAYTIQASFVLPNTFTPATTNFVAFTPTDASQFNSLFTMRAFDSSNQLITSVSRLVDSAGVYDPNVDTEMSIAAPGIAYVTMSVSSNGNNVIEGDDFRFNEVVPGPGTVSVLTCLAALRRRRR